MYAISVDELRGIAIEMSMMDCALEACDGTNKALDAHILMMQEEIENLEWWRTWTIPLGVTALLGGMAAGLAIGFTR